MTLYQSTENHRLKMNNRSQLIISVPLSKPQWFLVMKLNKCPGSSGVTLGGFGCSAPRSCLLGHCEGLAPAYTHTITHTLIYIHTTHTHTLVLTETQQPDLVLLSIMMSQHALALRNIPALNHLFASIALEKQPLLQPCSQQMGLISISLVILRVS